MENKTEWRPGPTVCRCCLAEGCYKDISTEYFWMGKREVYAEMLADTLDLTIGYSSSAGPYSNSRLICEPCITRLRDACDFKRQVQECEKTFMQQLNPENIPSVDVVVQPLETTVKVEAVKSEVPVSDDDGLSDVDFGVATADDDDDDDDDELDNEPLTKLASKVPKKEKDMVDLIDLADNRKATEKRKSSAKSKASPAKKAKTAAKVNEPVASASTASASKVEKKKKGTSRTDTSLTMGKGLESDLIFGRRKNAEIVLKYSTALAFKTVWSNFSCCYCSSQYEDINELKKHYAEAHPSPDVKDAFLKLSDGYINVDISDFKCKLCLTSFINTEAFLMHLHEFHQIKLENLRSGVMPFRRTNDKWVCVFCEQNFINFKDAKRHTPKHYRNFTCKRCNVSFLTVNAYEHHIGKKCKFRKTRFKYQLQHRTNAEIIIQSSTVYPFRMWNHKFSCVFCRELFMKPEPFRLHVDTKHADNVNVFYKCLGKEFLNIDITNMKCKFCDDHFDTLESIAVHLKKFHNKAIDLSAQMGVLPFKLNPALWSCLYCSQSFTDCSSLVTHTKGHFLNFVCDTCGEGFITEQALNAHNRVPHGNIYSCYRCAANFSSVDDRKNHMKEKHTKHPYVCYMCDDVPRFATWDAKQKHQLDVHKVQPNQYACQECTEVFTSRAAKYKHINKMHATKEFCCKECNRRFTTKLLLDNHVAKKHSAG